jgi:2-dehydro-3-deoxyphosphogluconate aldolase/(4S)-4-hydroxy-2-oxoglutarate aldolase
MVADLIESTGVVPVVVLDSASQAAPLSEALLAGGIPVMEVTFRTSAAAESISILAEDPRVLVGAGTVLTERQLDAALAAGAKFIVTPGFSTRIVRACQAADVPVYPGVATGTEIQLALEEGLEVVKFFPAGTSGGAAAVKALSAPFSMMRFIPTGGIGQTNMDDYLRLPSVLAVGGSWMVAPELVSAGAYDEVSALSATAVQQVTRSRDRVKEDS